MATTREQREGFWERREKPRPEAFTMNLPDRFRNLLGGAPETERAEVRTEDLQTPLDEGAIREAAQEIPLEDSDWTLTDLLDAAQMWVEQFGYDEHSGNAFFEQLATQFSDPSHLRKPVRISESRLWFVMLAEGYADMQDDLELTDEEVRAIRDAHHIYAEREGLEEYVTNTNLMCVRVREDPLRDMLLEMIVSAPGGEEAPFEVVSEEASG